MYLIKKRQYYVSKPGSRKSYTTNIRNAQIFKTKEAAYKNKCGNEHVVSVRHELTGMI